MRREVGGMKQFDADQDGGRNQKADPPQYMLHHPMVLFPAARNDDT
jgi:hypothetical protein